MCAKADDVAISTTIRIAISVRIVLRQVAAQGRSGTEGLLWRAKLAGEPGSSPGQMQRINPIALQAAKRPRPSSGNRHYNHHQAAAVLASFGIIRLTHLAI